MISDRSFSLPLLQLQHVSLAASVGLNYLLQDISFSVYKGDRLAIIGPSGAGKTSLIRLLNRLSTPTTGAIFFDNHDYQRLPILQLRQQIVLVSQEPKLLGMTVAETLAYPLKLQRLPIAEIQSRVNTWLEKLHIASDWLDRNELQLSVGQRQLVAIARALIMQPKILLLDEPTSALDAGRAGYLLEILQQLTQNQQMTILMINHQLELVQQFANRILYLENGELSRDQPVLEVDWTQLKEQFVQAETKAAQQWE